MHVIQFESQILQCGRDIACLTNWHFITVRLLSYSYHLQGKGHAMDGDSRRRQLVTFWWLCLPVTVKRSVKKPVKQLSLKNEYNTLQQKVKPSGTRLLT